jgi:hypothetical protein
MTAILKIQAAPPRLWERIQAFSFDTGPTAYPFWSRLASENGWSMGFAARAITEYRRFLYLAATAGHPVSPSDHVDQVWHLHLLYTDSYWNRLCRETLGMPLHHHPSVGGAAECDKFDGWYRNTLASYQRVFLEQPPGDIWPDPDAPSDGGRHYRRINTQRVWIIPKPWCGGDLVKSAWTQEARSR